MSLIHPTAVIDPSVIFEDDTIAVGPYAVIGPNVVLGSGCSIDGHAMLHKNITMGQRNRVASFASLGGDSQSRHDRPEDAGKLEIGNDNTFHEYCTINRGSIHDSGKTVIGDRNIFMMSTHVAHDCRLGHAITLVNQATLAGHVQVNDHAVIGHCAGVRQFCKIGFGAFIDRLSPINKDVMALTMVRGVPPKVLGINKVGMERLGYSVELIRIMEECHRIVFRRALEMEHARAQLSEYVGEFPEVQHMLDILSCSDRGLVR